MTEFAVCRFFQGSNLASKKDLNGSDPYVCMTLLDGEGKALQPKPDKTDATIEKTLNPVWDSQFIYHNDSTAAQECRLVQLECMDSNGDDFMGYAQFPLASVVDKYMDSPDLGFHRFDINLKPRPGNVTEFESI